MTNIIKTIIRDFIYVFLNYFVSYIPIWSIRKILYLLFGMKIGRGSRICMRCIIMSPWKIKIGKNTMINEYCLLDGRGGLSIGDNCSVSMWAVIYTASHISSSTKFEYFSRNTIIKDNCWIGTRAVVMPGSVINNKAILSVNSVFKGEAKENTIYVGNPAVECRDRGLESSYIQKNMNFFK